jgi:hypothetical protein
MAIISKLQIKNIKKKNQWSSISFVTFTWMIEKKKISSIFSSKINFPSEITLKNNSMEAEINKLKISDNDTINTKNFSYCNNLLLRNYGIKYTCGQFRNNFRIRPSANHSKTKLQSKAQKLGRNFLPMHFGRIINFM